MGIPKISNCIELHAVEGENPLKSTIDNFLRFANQQKVHGEMAWFALGKPIDKITQDELAYIRDQSKEKGVEWTANHWVGVKAPDPFFLTHPDEGVREVTAQYLAKLNRALFYIRGEVPGGVMVIGSPKERNLEVLESYRIEIPLEQGLDNFADVIARTVRYSKGTGVIMAPERLTRKVSETEGETDMVYTMEQAVQVAQMARSKLSNEQERVCVMVDFKAAYGSRETPTIAYELIPEELRTYHAHVQAGNLGPPGFRDDGVFLGPGFTNIANDVSYLMNKAAEGHEVVLSVEAFPPFFKGKNPDQIREMIGQGNTHLKELVAIAEAQLIPKL